MEEIPDVEGARPTNTLPDGHPSLLMTKEEYLQNPVHLKVPKQDKPKPSIRVDTHRPQRVPVKQLTKDTTPMVEYCQPTLSRVKVKDLITDPIPPRYLHYNNPQCEVPIAWTYDPHMPTEWNCMITDMQTLGGAKNIIKSALYGSPQLHEISDQMEFKLPPEDVRIYRLNPGSELEYEQSINELQEHYTPSSIKCLPKADKSKHKEEDIPSL
ncbi:hypothetical protein BDQ17DRAFT_1434247 [Cyathus striatus]|nr:hypothetical protein BDQ17DRAFT_1434247 [Cyathus striatus]